MSTEKCYPTSAAGELDAGKLERQQPCAKRAWCVLPADHTSKCVEVPRETQPKVKG